MVDLFRRARARRVGGSAAAGLAVGLLAFAGWLGWRSDPAPVWTSATSVVIMPSDEIDRWAAASAGEALSTGQVAATAAEVLRSPRIVADATYAQGIAESPPSLELTVTVEAVPDTTMLRIEVSAPARAIAEGTAEAVPGAGAAYLRGVSWPYRLVTVAPAGAASLPERSGGLLNPLIGAGLAGLAAQQSWYRLARRRQPRRPASEGSADG